MSAAYSQCSGQFQAGLLCGNTGASLALPGPSTVSAILDRNFGAPSTRGMMLNRGTSLWSATIAPVLGNPGTTTGSLGFAASAGATTTVQGSASSPWTFTLPTTGGTVGYTLTTDGFGTASWTAAGSGSVSSVGLVAPAEFTVTGSPITTTGSLTFTKATQSANSIWSGPTTGAAAAPTFRALVGADLPNPSSSTKGGVESIAAVTSNWINTISTSGVPTATQPAFTDISGLVAAAQLPNPSATTLGGIRSYAAVSNQWINAISISGVPSSAQPSFGQLSGTVALTQIQTISNNTVLANNAGSTSPPTALSASNILDMIGGTQGQVLYRDAAGWSVLAVGTSGQVLTTGGASANPAWATITGTGTVTSVATGTGLTGGPITTTGTISFATIANNTILANVSGGALAPSATTPTLVLDIIGATEGDILYRGASAWLVLAPGTSGQVLKTQGAGATPAWTTPTTSQWTTSGSNIYYTTGGVSIGTVSLATGASLEVDTKSVYFAPVDPTMQKDVCYGFGAGNCDTAGLVVHQVYTSGASITGSAIVGESLNQSTNSSGHDAFGVTGRVSNSAGSTNENAAVFGVYDNAGGGAAQGGAVWGIVSGYGGSISGVIATNKNATGHETDTNGGVGVLVDFEGPATIGFQYGMQVIGAVQYGVLIGSGSAGLPTYPFAVMNTGTRNFLVNANGYVAFTGTGAGSTPLCYDTSTFSGLAALSGCVSDERLKHDVKAVSDWAWLKALRLKPSNFVLNADTTNRTDAGFIAQDVREVVPEAITNAPGTEVLSLNINPIVAYTVKAYQQLFYFVVFLTLMMLFGFAAILVQNRRF